MSVKKENDLNNLCGFDTEEEKSFRIEQDDRNSTDIDIKFEFPYQSLQFSLTVRQTDDKQQKDSILVETRDPLELNDDDVDDYSKIKTEVKQSSSKPSYLWAPTSTPKKLKKLKTAICTKCNTGFPSTFLFEQHMIQIHQDDRPYPCKHCGKPFATPDQQKTHETIHDPKRFQGEPQFSCDICGRSYHLKRSLAGHKLRTHAGYIPPKRPHTAPIKEHHSTSGSKNPNGYRKPKEIHSCPHCDLTFKIKTELKRHSIVHKERTFSCPICQQPFAVETVMKTHIKNIHEHRTNLTGRPTLRPKWQAKQPCPCTICGKIYPIPSQLSRHMLLHAGEKPISCNKCDLKFRTKGELNSHKTRKHLKDQLRSNPLKLYKCRVCGRDDFILFGVLEQHRRRHHKNIPYDSEKEKPFACGICGKPHFLREGAIICALLSHDSSRLRKQMFKVRCPECPDEEILRFHNVPALRRHWDKEHGDKKLPAKFRQGMYDGMKLKDELPYCTFDKKKREDIRINGVDLKQVEREGAMYRELDLLEIPEDERFFKRKIIKREVETRERFCGVCGLKVSSESVLKRHLNAVHKLSVVNIKRKNAVQAILNFQTVTVNLRRIDQE